MLTPVARDRHRFYGPRHERHHHAGMVRRPKPCRGTMSRTIAHHLPTNPRGAPGQAAAEDEVDPLDESAPRVREISLRAALQAGRPAEQTEPCVWQPDSA